MSSHLQNSKGQKTKDANLSEMSPKMFREVHIYTKHRILKLITVSYIYKI